ncbi:MAG TPA: hypothetical protein VH228_17270 [Nocardioides sp.]|jgi:hypothetical protein|nr:hypothetical protein [Nocardioides sp.]
MSDEQPTESEQTTEMFGEPTDPADPPRSWAAGKHPVNVLHLVMGVAFLGLFVNWALIQSDVLEAHDLRWLLPIPWVAAGAAGLIATAPRLRGTRD